MLNQSETSNKTKPDPLSLAYELEDISPWRKNLSGQVVRSYVSFWGFVSKHWLSILNGVNLACVIGSFAAPLLAAAGFTAPANALYGLFAYTCVQVPEHSFYIAGQQMCVCQRCLGIYSGLLFFGLLFHFLRNYTQPLKIWQFALFFCTPIGFDSFTQMFGWRESTWELRLITGAIFALGAVWTLYPMMNAKMGGLKRWVAREQSLT